MLHFVTSYMKRNKSRKQTLESAQYGLEISFKGFQQNRKPRDLDAGHELSSRFVRAAYIDWFFFTASFPLLEKL